MLTHLIIVAAALGICLLLLATRVIDLERDLVLLFFLAEALAYVFVAPAIYASGALRDDPTLAGYYSLVMVGALLLFLPLLIVSYLGARRLLNARRASERRPFLLSVRPFFAFLTVGTAIVFPILYLATLQNAGLLYRRIGSEGLAVALVELPRYQFLIIRIFDRLAVPLAALVLMVVAALPRKRRRFALLGFAIVTGTYLYITVINSRLNTILAIAALFIVAVQWQLIRIRLRAKRVVQISSIALLAAYMVNATMNLRAGWQTEPNRLKLLSPLYKPPADFADTQPALRLNCVDLMARMTPSALERGFAKGSAWWPSIVVTFGQFIAPEVAREYKLGLGTTPKFYLMRSYAGLELPDYFSCTLTDVYGNLGFAGFAIAGAALGPLLALTTIWLFAPRRSWQIVVAVIMLQIYTSFEFDFIGMVLLAWPVNAPGLVILLALNPFRIRRGEEPGSEAFSPSQLQASTAPAKS